MRKRSQALTTVPINQPNGSSGGGFGGSGCLILIIAAVIVGSIWAFSAGAGLASNGGGFNFEPRAFSDNITAQTDQGGNAVAVGRGARDVTVTSSQPGGQSVASTFFGNVLAVLFFLALGGGAFFWVRRRANYDDD